MKFLQGVFSSVAILCIATVLGMYFSNHAIGECVMGCRVFNQACQGDETLITYSQHENSGVYARAARINNTMDNTMVALGSGQIIEKPWDLTFCSCSCTDNIWIQPYPCLGNDYHGDATPGTAVTVVRPVYCDEQL